MIDVWLGLVYVYAIEHPRCLVPEKVLDSCFVTHSMPCQLHFLLLDVVFFLFHCSKAELGYTIIKLLFTFLKDAHRGLTVLTEGERCPQRALVLALEEKPAMKSMGLQIYINICNTINQWTKMVQEFILPNIFVLQYEYENLEYILGSHITSCHWLMEVPVRKHPQFLLECTSTLSDNNLHWGLIDWFLVLVYVYAIEHPKVLNSCLVSHSMPCQLHLFYIVLLFFCCCLLLSVVFISLQRDSLYKDLDCSFLSPLPNKTKIVFTGILWYLMLPFPLSTPRNVCCHL